MKSAILVLKEQFEHFYLIRRLSLFELKSYNNSNYLGMSWEIINPVIQILIYWFVFGSINKRADVEIVPGRDVPFVAWLICGFIVWNFFYQSTIQGSKSIYTRLAMLSKMNFPMSVIPNFVIFAQFYIHATLVIISSLILTTLGFPITIYHMQLFYFVFAAFAFVFSLSLITSTLSTIIRDIHQLIFSGLRMFFYVSPVIWPISTILGDSGSITILKLNPLFYLIEGYRAAMLGLNWYFIVHWKYTIYFWCVVFFLYLIGSILHVKFRRHFIDYL